MKKTKFKPFEISIMAVVLVLGFGLLALAQNWHTANQSTLAWDPVTTNINGEALPADGVVKYTVFLANATTDPEKTNPALIAESIPETQYTFTLNAQGKFIPGVKSELWVAGELVEESVIAWSDDPEFTQSGEAIGLRYFLPPKAAGGLRFQ